MSIEPVADFSAISKCCASFVNQIKKSLRCKAKQPTANKQHYLMRIANTKCTMVWINGYLYEDIDQCALYWPNESECKRFGNHLKQHWKALIVFYYEYIKL